jgi:hypothetical protein
MDADANRYYRNLRGEVESAALYPGTALDTLAREELGIDPQGVGGSAWVGAGTSFALFADLVRIAHLRCTPGSRRKLEPDPKRQDHSRPSYLWSSTDPCRPRKLMTLNPVPSADRRTTTSNLDDAAITELRAFNLRFEQRLDLVR